MQLAHRKIVNSTELLLTTSAKLQQPEISEAEAKLISRQFAQLQRELRLTVRLIKGHYARRIRFDNAANPELEKLAQHLPFDWQGFLWLGANTRNEVSGLVILLQRTRRRWLDGYELQRLRTYLLERRAGEVSEEQAV